MRRRYPKLHESINTDLLLSKQSFAEQQEQIQGEKLKISRELLQLESENQKLREQAGFARRQRDAQSQSFEEIKEELEDLEESVDYLENLIKDYASHFNRELPVGEKELFETKIQPLLAFQSTVDWSKKIDNLEDGFIFLKIALS